MDWKSVFMAAPRRLHAEPLPVFCYQWFLAFLASFVYQRTVVCTRQHSKNDSDDYEGLRIGNLRLHGALTWRNFRFIVIRGFYPFFSQLR